MTLSILGSGIITTEDSSVQLLGSSIIIPRGNTANRPTTAVSGMIRFNEETNVFELYGGNAWLTVTQPANVTLELIVVAGGGASSGGSSTDRTRQAGGGGGGAIVGNVSLGAVTSVSINSVGAGGTNGSPGGQTSTSGANSIITLVGRDITTLTAIGGGFGQYTPQTAPGGPFPVSNGGCGGGAGGFGTASPALNEFKFSGNGTIGQGFAGGAAWQIPIGIGGGGGGAGQAGGNTSPTSSGFGGNGYLWLDGKFYAGGGGAYSFTGGRGGGGPGLNNGGWSGNVNTGGGGGGGAGPAGSGGPGNGGSGVIMLAHSNVIANAVISAGLVVTVNTQVIPGFFVYEITGGTGTLNWGGLL